MTPPATRSPCETTKTMVPGQNLKLTISAPLQS